MLSLGYTNEPAWSIAAIRRPIFFGGISVFVRARTHCKRCQFELFGLLIKRASPVCAWDCKHTENMDHPAMYLFPLAVGLGGPRVRSLCRLKIWRAFSKFGKFLIGFVQTESFNSHSQKFSGTASPKSSYSIVSSNSDSSMIQPNTCNLVETLNLRATLRFIFASSHAS